MCIKTHFRNKDHKKTLEKNRGEKKRNRPKLQMYPQLDYRGADYFGSSLIRPDCTVIDEIHYGC